MANYKLLALDMDGTVLNSEEKISAENRKWIAMAQDAGVLVMFATGRGIHRTLPYVHDVGFTSPIIACNGSDIWKDPVTRYRDYSLPEGMVRKLRALAVANDTWYWGYGKQGPVNKDTWRDEDDDRFWMKFGFQTEEESALERIASEAQSWGCLEISNSHPCNLEMNPQGISKASGLQEVCALLGITMSQVVAVGDSLNDVSMIRAAGLGVAMGNAQDCAKEVADWITASNDEHGVAKLIREKILV